MKIHTSQHSQRQKRAEDAKRVRITRSRDPRSAPDLASALIGPGLCAWIGLCTCLALSVRLNPPSSFQPAFEATCVIGCPSASLRAPGRALAKSDGAGAFLCISVAGMQRTGSVSEGCADAGVCAIWARAAKRQQRAALTFTGSKRKPCPRQAPCLKTTWTHVVGHVLGLHRAGAGGREWWWLSCGQAEHSARVNRRAQQALEGFPNARGSPLTGI